MDMEARTYMALAATYAGIGFGNAGVHVPHSIAYPIAGMVKNFSPPAYPKDERMIPHGPSVAVTPPPTSPWTYPTNPKRHRHPPQRFGAKPNGPPPPELQRR